jgi:uridine kinase
MSQSSAHITVIFIGIAGPSGCGKSTYAKHLVDHLCSPLYPIELDHFFRDPLILNHPILGPIKSYEQPECLNLKDFFNLLHQIKQNPKQITRYHREDILINENTTILIIIEGLSECRIQRYRRRNKIPHTISNENIIVTEEFQQWFDHLVWDEYLKRRDLQIGKSEKIFHSNEYQQKQYASLDNYIAQRIREIIMHKTNNNLNT